MPLDTSPFRKCKPGHSPRYEGNNGTVDVSHAAKKLMNLMCSGSGCIKIATCNYSCHAVTAINRIKNMAVAPCFPFYGPSSKTEHVHVNCETFSRVLFRVHAFGFKSTESSVVTRNHGPDLQNILRLIIRRSQVYRKIDLR